MLAIAARALPGRAAQADLRSLPLTTASLDAIWCCAALLHVPQDQTVTVLAEMHRVLPCGGHLALVTAVTHRARLETVPYAPDRQRSFFYRDPDPLREQLPAAALQILDLTREAESRRTRIYSVLARAALLLATAGRDAPGSGRPAGEGRRDAGVAGSESALRVGNGHRPGGRVWVPAAWCPVKW